MNNFDLFIIFSMILACISSNGEAKRSFFVPDKEKCAALLQAQKNVAKKNTIKDVPALSARPTGVFRSPEPLERAAERLACVRRWFGILLL